ncbi:MAG: Rrf2 family transcriptional regulator [Holophagales bacterium]|nr:MAG: Rrf2 family transcriptional regulator [Holophagales bacterium]
MISQTTGYAISALAYLAGAGERSVLVREIAEALDQPTPYLAKIVNALSRRRIVVTQRGIGGGVALAQASASLSLWDICKALDDPAVEARCLLALEGCSDERACPAHQFWKSHREAIWSFLRETTLADMAAFEALCGRAPAALHPTLSSASGAMRSAARHTRH